MPTWVCQHSDTKYGNKKYCKAFNRGESRVCRKCGVESYSEFYRYDGADGLVEKTPVAEALEKYAEHMLELDLMFDRMVEIEQSFKSTLGLDVNIIRQFCTDRAYVSTGEAVRYLHTVTKRMIWARLVHLLDMERFASTKKMKEFDDSLKDPNLPEPTTAAVSQWMNTMMSSLDDMVAEKAASVFDFLRPRHTGLKTNTKSEGVASKIIIKGVVSWSFSRPRITSYYRQNLIEMESLFNTWDGRGYGANRNISALQEAIESSHERDGTGETPFFKVRVFKNGNLHLEFKRLDLLTKLNKVCGSTALPTRGDG